MCGTLLLPSLEKGEGCSSGYSDASHAWKEPRQDMDLAVPLHLEDVSIPPFLYVRVRPPNLVDYPKFVDHEVSDKTMPPSTSYED